MDKYLLPRRINLGFRYGERYIANEKPRYYESHYNNEREKSRNWNAIRGYLEYNNTFSSITNVSIEEFIKSKLNSSKKAYILEFGLGRGFFANDIKTQFGHDLVYDGVTYDKYPEIESLLDKELIDSVHYGRAEEYEFNKKYDLIIDFFGPIFYLDPVSATRLLLKSVSHLNNGGIYLIGFIRPMNSRKNRIFDFLKSKGYIVLQNLRSVAIIRPPIPSIITLRM